MKRKERERNIRIRKVWGWDSNRGIAGDVSLAWGDYEGAGPLCRSASSFYSRDFEYPPSPPLKEVLSSELSVLN